MRLVIVIIALLIAIPANAAGVRRCQADGCGCYFDWRSGWRHLLAKPKHRQCYLSRDYDGNWYRECNRPR